MADQANIKVEGLSETLRMLSKVDKGLRKEVGAVMREQTKRIKNEAYARSRIAPGVRRRGYPITKGAYIRRATATKAQVGISRASSRGRNAAVFPAEFGWNRQALNWPNQRSGGRSKYVSQNSMVRRTFPIWRGNNTKIVGKSGPGWIMLPVLRKRVPKIRDEIEAEVTKLFRESARKSGVKIRGG